MNMLGSSFVKGLTPKVFLVWLFLYVESSYVYGFFSYIHQMIIKKSTQTHEF